MNEALRAVVTTSTAEAIEGGREFTEGLRSRLAEEIHRLELEVIEEARLETLPSLRALVRSRPNPTTIAMTRSLVAPVVVIEADAQPPVTWCDLPASTGQADMATWSHDGRLAAHVPPPDSPIDAVVDARAAPAAGHHERSAPRRALPPRVGGT